MNSINADLSTTLNRILDAAAENLRIAKILVQLGLDPNNITYDALFNRLLEIFLANITLANMFALVGAIFFVATLLTHTMVPLRVANMIGCAFFAMFGLLTGAVTTFLLYLLMVPINAYRLRQMLVLVKKARSATQGDTSMEWLKPFMTERKYRKGDTLFKKDDAADEMLLTVTGKFLVKEINVELPPGRLMGELGFLTPDNRRTATIQCIEDGHVLTITYEKLLEIYFQNPQFGYYFLVLTSQRLLENIARLESAVAQSKTAGQAAAAGGPIDVRPSLPPAPRRRPCTMGSRRRDHARGRHRHPRRAAAARSRHHHLGGHRHRGRPADRCRIPCLRRRALDRAGAAAAGWILLAGCLAAYGLGGWLPAPIIRCSPTFAPASARSSSVPPSR